MTRRSLAALVLLALPSVLSAQQRPLPLKLPARATANAITPADLMSRVYIFADDSMMGRAAGTIYHDKGTEYIARELTRLGLKPGGENGTFFQRIPLVERRLAEGARITVDGRDFAVWRDYLPRDIRDLGTVGRPMKNATVVYGGVFGDTSTMLRPEQAVGRVVVFSLPRGWQTNRPMLVERYVGAAAVVVATLDSLPEPVQHFLRQPGLLWSAGERQLAPAPLFFYVTLAMAQAMLGAPPQSLQPGTLGKIVSGGFSFAETPAPGSRNVIAMLPGSDPALRGQYVAIGAHSDHVGFGEPVDHDSLYAFYHIARPQGAEDGSKPASPEDWPKIRSMLDSLRRVHSVRQDSIFNGADDDGSGSMGLLEVAEAFANATEKPRRSVLFVWHVGEELGLLGSQYFTDNPTVPRDSIVAQINIDMIDRKSVV